MSTVDAPVPVCGLIISVSEGGEVKFLWNDSLAPLLELGEGRIVRASHVEPDGTLWSADLSPVGGPTLGPFQLRQEALDAERTWLEENDFGKAADPISEKDGNERIEKKTR